MIQTQKLCQVFLWCGLTLLTLFVLCISQIALMVDFGMRNDDEFYNKMESSTAVSTKTAFAIAMDGICEGGAVWWSEWGRWWWWWRCVDDDDGNFESWWRWQWWFRYKSWCANYILNILCCQRKRKQNHIDYEAANTFKHIVFYSTGDELKSTIWNLRCKWHQRV